jgi:hypothetical protein
MESYISAFRDVFHILWNHWRVFQPCGKYMVSVTGLWHFWFMNNNRTPSPKAHEDRLRVRTSKFVAKLLENLGVSRRGPPRSFHQLQPFGADKDS